MKSFAFPDMLSSSKVKLAEDKEATYNNVRLLLLSSKKELFGDPYFGSKLIKLLFEPNNKVLIDIAIDYIYTAIVEFMPQLYIERNNINLVQDKDKLYINFTAVNQLDFSTDLYSIALIGDEE